eukprot:6167680-Pyramimonas_sp.AAC.1
MATLTGARIPRQHFDAAPRLDGIKGDSGEGRVVVDGNVITSRGPGTVSGPPSASCVSGAASRSVSQLLFAARSFRLARIDDRDRSVSWRPRGVHDRELGGGLSLLASETAFALLVHARFYRYPLSLAKQVDTNRICSLTGPLKQR